MIFKPKCLGKTVLPPDQLAEDKKKCLVVGPCGLGRKALYLNSFFLDRVYYIAYADVQRCFKRVAMSKGGYSGKGTFGSIPYLVVQYNNGEEKQCNFKYEDQVDTFLEQLGIRAPQISHYSKEAERKLKEAEAKEQARYLKELSPEAERSVKKLNQAKEFLEARPASSTRLAAAAKQKRVIDAINPTYQKVAAVILGLGIAAAVFGIYALLRHLGGAIYFVLFGLAFIFLIMSTRVLPTGSRNKKTAKKEWDDALNAMRGSLKGEKDFPVPAQYAHPIVLERMIRVIREGRAKTIPEAYEIMKKDLKALNSSVTVTQKEYDEVVVVKPLFLVYGYKDE